MKIIKVKLPKNSYQIVIGSGVLKSLPKFIAKLVKAKNAVIITNPVIKKIYSAKISRILKHAGYSVKYLVVPDSEKSKSLKYFTEIIAKIAKLSGNKPIFIIALGGGVIGDLSGFVAAVYKRGVPYIQIPTTLLAQVDSAIGGKTAIDLSEGKNLVGAFYQPSLVLSDTDLLKSLSKRQIVGGLAEVIKYSLILDPKLFDYLVKNVKNILNLKKECIEHIVYCSSLHKVKIIQVDERETKGIRTILNFGHTIGHAIEAASNFKITHGEAVAAGMAAAAEISLRLRLITRSEFLKIIGLIKSAGLAVKVKNINLAKALKSLSYDKKFIHGKNRLVLIKGIGKATVKEGINPSIIKEVIKNVLV